MKENLQRFFAVLIQIFAKDMPLKEKIEWQIEQEFAFLEKNPALPLFISNELKNTKTDIFNLKNIKETVKTSLFAKQVKVAIANKEIEPLTATELIFFVLSNIHYVFIAKEVIKNISDYDNDAYNAYIKRHKKRVKDLIINYVFIEN